MHIKQVIISGFRSFRNQGEIESFSPKHNVIVGRNGSGKSNFFDAIQFVLLAPRFANLRQEDRQQLLHEGAGSGVMAAYVEIIFDNSDGRMSVEGDEVVLRRTVGHKKDEFFINRKRVQKTEVVSLLESAGFSKSNPYYIVQQGKVANLCVMKDKDRLELLKEVAGTTVYEERRTESMKITQETVAKQEQINEVLQFIEDRLSELEQEKDELTDYEQLDKSRRSCEFNLYEKELEKANNLFKELESSREEDRRRQQDLYSRICEIQAELQKAGDVDLEQSKSAAERLLNKKSSKASELARATTRLSELEVQLLELETFVVDQKVEGAQLIQSLTTILENIDTSERELAKIDPVYDSKNNELSKCQAEMESLHHRVETLYNKQGRGAQFRTKKERDNFLQQQINQLQAQVTTSEKVLAELRAQCSYEETRIAKEFDTLSRAEHEQKLKNQNFKDIGKLIHEKIQNRNDLQEQRKEGWKELEIIQEQIQEARYELERGKQQLSSSLPRSISQGLAMADIIATEMNLEGYYGPLIDNFELKNDAFQVAVEVAAGNALFNVIVDTDATAALLIKELDKRKSGRLTFLPLNRLQPPHFKYPDSNDVRPLIDVAINYDKDFEVAVRHVFGNKLLAKDLDVAAHYSKEFDLDAITKDGDVVNRRGGFEGGFRDERESKIGSIYRIRRATQRYIELQNKEQEINKRIESVDKSINEVIRDLQKIEADREHFKSSNEQLTNELAGRSKQLTASSKALDIRRRDIEAQEKELMQTRQQIQDYLDEQKSPLQSRLRDEEKEELQSHLERRDPLLESIERLQSELMEINLTREKLRADLTGNLLKRRDDLQARLSVIGDSRSQSQSKSRDIDAEISTAKSERDITASQVETLKTEIEEIEKLRTKRLSEVSKFEKTVESLRAEEEKAQNELADLMKDQDKILNRRAMLTDTIQSKQRLIRDLGTVPKKEVEESKELTEKDLMKKLREVNEKLKKYSSVNRKALDQYISFTEQRDTLVTRKEELDRDYRSIEQLIETLDTQKEDAILRTFRGVSHHFSEVFQELVPGGKGQLVMKTTEDDLTDESTSPKRESDERKSSSAVSKAAASSVNRFLGVQVRVSFAGTGQQFDMQQLSGGQKALVALALIFAIQRCDPAPFYLFDEIDQALDANYRAGVARLISKQADSSDAPAQFITTTFRPELVSVGNKFFGIALQNKVSNIYPLEKAEAQNFVDNILQEEALGVVSSVPTFSRQNITSAPSVSAMSHDEEDFQALSETHDTEDNDEGNNMGDFEQAESALKKMAVREPQQEEESEEEVEVLTKKGKKSGKRGSKRVLSGSKK